MTSGPRCCHQRRLLPWLALAISSTAWGVTTPDWRDCSADGDGHTDPQTFGPFAVIVDRQNESFPTYRPAKLLGADAPRWPMLVCMHGSGSDDRFLSPSLSRWASHGIIVIAPLMGDEASCKNPLEDYECSDHSPNGRFILAAIRWIAEMNTRPGTVFHARVNMDALAIGGWSMGGVSAIKAVANLPTGIAIRAVVLDSPSVQDCGLLAAHRARRDGGRARRQQGAAARGRYGLS
eukprot:SAG31_NODE_6354_length_2047_cov_2.109343_2_plen_235_part_00